MCSNSLSWSSGSEHWPFQAMLGGILQPPEPKLLISRAQERRRLRLDTAAPTYRHAVFSNPLPQVIYSNTDSADSGAHVPPHYAVTQTGLFALPLQIRRTCMTSPGDGGGVARRSCEAEGGSITAGERAWLCNDDAYQCPGCKTSLLIVFLCTSGVRSRLQLQGLHSRVCERSNIRGEHAGQPLLPQLLFPTAKCHEDI